MTAHLKAHDLRLSISGVRILDGIDLEIAAEEAVALVGPSGAGKSTTLRALLGLQQVDEGQVTVNEQPIKSMTGRERARELGWLPQMGIVAEPIRVLDLVAAARFRFDEGRAASEAAARSALGGCGIDRLCDQPITTLSGGEFQRVIIAGLLAQDARCFLLDEPSNHLDVRRQQELYALLGEQWRAGRGLVMITHDVNLLSALGPADNRERVRVVALKEGRVCWSRPFDSSDLAEALSDLFDLEMCSIDVGGQRMIMPVMGDMA